MGKTRSSSSGVGFIAWVLIIAVISFILFWPFMVFEKHSIVIQWVIFIPWISFVIFVIIKANLYVKNKLPKLRENRSNFLKSQDVVVEDKNESITVETSQDSFFKKLHKKKSNKKDEIEGLDRLLEIGVISHDEYNKRKGNL